jgi:hypothetical protein
MNSTAITKEINIMEKETIWRVPSLERDMNRVDNNTATSLNEKFISPPEKKSTNKDSIVRIINAEGNLILSMFGRQSM